MANNDLHKWITSDIDFYELLGIEFGACTEAELRRAYRKTALKYHPDKVGANYDAEKYEIFQTAYEVLSNADSKAQYDQHRLAKVQRQRANELFEGKRKQMKEDLEAREKNGIQNAPKRHREDETNQADLLQPELLRLAEEGRKRRAARASMKKNAEPPIPIKTPVKEDNISAKVQASEDSSTYTEQDREIERLEEKLRRAEKLKAKRSAEKKAKMKGSGSFGTDVPKENSETRRCSKTDEKSSINTPYSPSTARSQLNDFSETMARLKAAEKSRLGTKSTKLDS